MSFLLWGKLCFEESAVVNAPKCPSVAITPQHPQGLRAALHMHYEREIYANAWMTYVSLHPLHGNYLPSSGTGD